jgi:gliding motility-associated-like protein
MKKIGILLFIIMTVGKILGQITNTTCATAAPFCTNTTYSFPMATGTSAETGPNYACLCLQPNPVWYYMLIDQPGDLIVHIYSPTGNDVDFVCYGPFNTLTGACNQLTAGCSGCVIGGCPNNTTNPSFYPSGNVVDCSYDPSSDEYLHIYNAQTGQYYMLCITNFSDEPGDLVFQKTGGTATTNCTIVTCGIDNLQVTSVSACNPATNTYSVSGTVTFHGQPTTGQLTAQDNSGLSTSTSAPFTSPWNFTISNIPADGQQHTITVNFSGAPTCQQTVTYNAPAACTPTCPLQIRPDTTICAGSSVQLWVTGADTYQWSPSGSLNNANIANPIATPSTTTTYTVTGTVTATGCTNTAQVTVTVNALPNVTASATPSSICQGEQSTLTASGATTYTWDNGLGAGSSFTVSPSSTTVYTVTGTASNGCTNTAHVILSVRTVPTVTASASPATICVGQQSTLTAGGALSYNWDQGLGTGQNKVVSPTSTTTFTVTGTASNGCTNTAQVTVTVNALPTIIASATPNPVCSGQQATLSASGGVSYAWDHGLGAGQMQQVYPMSSTTYTVTGTDGNGCSNTAQVTINVNPLPTVSANAQPDHVCPGSQSALSASGAATYVWDHGLGNGQNQTVNPSVTTTYIVTGTDNNGCSNTAQVTVTTYPLPNVVPTANPNPICIGDQTTLSVSGATTYVWDQGIGAGITHQISPQTTTTYTVTGTDNHGCSNTGQVTVVVNPLPTIVLTATPDSICRGESSTLTPSGGVSYVWSSGLGTGQMQIVTPMNTTTYTVTGTDANGCKNTAQTTVTVNPVPVITLNICNEHCGQQDGMVTAEVTSGTPPYQYQWSNGGTTQTIQHLSAGNYVVTVIDQNGCKNTSTAVVSNMHGPVAAFTLKPRRTTMENPSITFLNESSGGTQCFWDFGDQTMSNEWNPMHIYDADGEYNVLLQVCDSFGCCDTAQTVVYIDKIVLLYIPDAFSPNDDGINDVFYIYADGILTESFELSIYDRWGVQVFHTTDINQYWDGTYQGKKVPLGCYIYKLTYSTKEEAHLHRYGRVCVIR